MQEGMGQRIWTQSGETREKLLDKDSKVGVAFHYVMYFVDGRNGYCYIKGKSQDSIAHRH